MAVPEIIFIVDRSGSMQAIREGMIQGLNDFVTEVQKTPGDGFWSYITFDEPRSAGGAREQFPNIVFERVPDREVPKFTLDHLKPRGGTALIDACCLTLAKLRDRLKNLPESERPRVMIVIITDGEENESQSYTRDSLRALTAEVQTDYGVEFLYLGANQDAFANAKNYGVVQTATGWAGGQNVMNLQGDLNNALPMLHTNEGAYVSLTSGATGTRAWKNMGNPTAENLVMDHSFKSNMSGG